MASSFNPVVKTKSGSLQGIERNGLYVFKGIPYADPPVGRLRWMPPKPVKPWTGVRPADKYGDICPQIVMPASDMGVPSFADQKQSEDCLTLNIWTPGLGDAGRPVMFWIHGGAFTMGAGTESFLEEGVLARRGNIVIVSINYRLGALGFLNLKEITGGKIPATGNEGILDQIAALEWVRENIKDFGGNPDNITISGFSAGAMSVGILMGMPAASGKFSKVMNRSGAPDKLEKLENAMQISEMFLNKLNIRPHDTEVLYSFSSQQILDAQQNLSDEIKKANSGLKAFSPVLDGSRIMDNPVNIIKKGSAKKIPILSGCTRDELKFETVLDKTGRIMDEAELHSKVQEILPGKDVSGIINAYHNAYNKRGQNATPVEILGSIKTDRMFKMPALRLLEIMRDKGSPAYNYLFMHKSPAMNGVLGAIHGLDNPFLFGKLINGFTGIDSELEQLAIKIQDSCIAFMATGNPSCESVGKWPVYGKKHMTMIFDRNSRVEAGLFDDELAAWDKYL